MKKAGKIRITVGIILLLLITAGAVLAVKFSLKEKNDDPYVNLTDPSSELAMDESVNQSLRITPIWRTGKSFDDTVPPQRKVKELPAAAVYHKKPDVSEPGHDSIQFKPQPPSAPQPASDPIGPVTVAVPFTGNADGGSVPVSVREFLKGALEPIGKCLYVYGGGWNEADTGAGTEAMTYGPSPEWEKFFYENDGKYNYANHMYKIHEGLDCTGYIGYSVYQVFGDSFSKNGYVYTSGTVGTGFQKLFGGTVTTAGSVKEYRAGDIMYKKGHAFLVIGKCSDGSLVFLHASPPDVTVCGTYSPSGNQNSEAVVIAHEYMDRKCHEAHSRYENCSRNTSYLTDYNQFRFPEEAMNDPDGFWTMTPKEILDNLIS